MQRFLLVMATSGSRLGLQDLIPVLFKLANFYASVVPTVFLENITSGNSVCTKHFFFYIYLKAFLFEVLGSWGVCDSQKQRVLFLVIIWIHFVFLWQIKPTFVIPDRVSCAVIRYHSRRVTCLEFHPTKNDVLLSGDKVYLILTVVCPD